MCGRRCGGVEMRRVVGIGLVGVRCLWAVGDVGVVEGWVRGLGVLERWAFDGWLLSDVECMGGLVGSLCYGYICFAQFTKRC